MRRARSGRPGFKLRALRSRTQYGSDGAFAEAFPSVVPLSRMEEEDLVRRSQAGDKAATDRLVRQCGRWVITIARSHMIRAGSQADFDDLVSEGMVGLLTAIRKFDTSKGLRLLTYATSWIRSSMQRSFRAQRFVSFPEWKELVLNAMNSGKNTMDLDALAGEYGVSPEEVETMAQEQTKSQTFVVESHHSDESGSKTPAEPQLYDPDDPVSVLDIVAAEEDKEILLESVNSLSERDREVILRRFGVGGNMEETLESVGKVLCCTRERVRQIEAQAIVRLRERLKGKMSHV